ncbi:hypothetical protein ACH5RR_017043 [Cinchona calisaya]|uniref:BHLH domain-containing protein n=1 Tax=Cinchona calisaya TaxID=153742 RepID=A0ABD2ZYU2_9GENT
MDDFTSSLIPIQQDDPLLFPYLDHTNTIHHQDLINQGASSLASLHQENEVTLNTNAAGRRQRKSSSVRDNTNLNSDDNKQKRAVHRDIERLRRQEMANLYSSLRTLLPLEYIKGKRSISDHVHEAVNYIKHMEKKIMELEVKRDSLRNLLDGSDLDVKNVKARNYNSSITFTVRPCSGGGIEILVKNDLADNQIPLSKILDALLDEGLAVVSCVCTKVDQNFLCTILTDQPSHMKDVDLNFLQEKLTDKVIS